MTSQIINNHSGWKQPTPTDINLKQELTAVERSIFREILSLCQNKDTLINFIQADKHYSVELKRGQCIFKVRSFAKDFEVDRKRIRRGVDIVSKWYSQLDIKAMPYGLVITVINYDDIVKMDSQLDNERTMKGQSKDNERTTNKSVESVKSVKTDKRRGSESSSKIKKVKYSAVEDIGEIEIQEIATAYEVPISFVESKVEDIRNYCESTGKSYKNYLATLRGWVKRDSEKLRKEAYGNKYSKTKIERVGI